MTKAVFTDPEVDRLASMGKLFVSSGFDAEIIPGEDRMAGTVTPNPHSCPLPGIAVCNIRPDKTRPDPHFFYDHFIFALLTTCLCTAVRRHEAFRSVFHGEKGSGPGPGYYRRLRNDQEYRRSRCSGRRVWLAEFRELAAFIFEKNGFATTVGTVKTRDRDREA